MVVPLPEAAIDVALVGADQEPDGDGGLELQAAHRLSPAQATLLKGEPPRFSDQDLKNKIKI